MRKVFEVIIQQVNQLFFSDHTAQILVTVFVAVIGLSIYGARRMEEN